MNAYSGKTSNIIENQILTSLNSKSILFITSKFVFLSNTRLSLSKIIVIQKLTLFKSYDFSFNHFINSQSLKYLWISDYSIEHIKIEICMQSCIKNMKLSLKIDSRSNVNI